MQSTRSYDAIIVGAGAAGLYCAAIAGQRGRRMLLIDHSPNPGAKILISGGGHCNFTNIGATAANFLSGNPHFAKSALSRHLKFPHCWSFLFRGGLNGRPLLELAAWPLSAR